MALKTDGFRKVVLTLAKPLAIGLIVVASGCRTDRANDPDTLARVGDARFTLADLREAMPSGVTGDDSVRLAAVIVRNWAEERLLNAAARRNITDMERIDRMVEQYRSDLILHEYRRLMFEQKASKTFHPDSIRAYYEANAAQLRLQRPVLKGIYLKVPDDVPDLKRMARWTSSTSTSDLDHLEQAASREATHYDYFRDRWVDWEQIENKIPFDFGPDPNAFLRTHKHLETSADGFTYVLDVTDFIPAGNPMPIEFATPAIKEALTNLRRTAFDASLRRQMLDQAIDDGTAEIFVPRASDKTPPSGV